MQLPARTVNRHTIHAAADIRLFAPLEELRQANVTGTRRVLELAQAVQDDHGLSCFAHVSSAYVAGRRSGPVAEAELSDRCGFSSPYEQSKYEAELLVREAMAHLPGIGKMVSFRLFRAAGWKPATWGRSPRMGTSRSAGARRTF